MARRDGTRWHGGRDGRQAGQAWLGADPQAAGSGRWQASYVGPDLVRHNAPHTYTAKMDAERWLADERRLIEQDNWNPPAARSAEKKAKSVTVAEYADTWVEQRSLKPRTRRTMRRCWQHIEPPLGGCR